MLDVILPEQLNFQFAIHIYTDVVLIYLEVNTGKQLLITDASLYSGVTSWKSLFVFGKHPILALFFVLSKFVTDSL